MFERFSDRARKVMALSNQEAQRFNHEYVGTEHILLGLLKEGSGVGATALKNLGIDLRKVRLEVEMLVKSGPECVTLGKLPQTPRAKRVIEESIKSARDLGHTYVGTEHILLGLIREHDGVAAQVLFNLGVQLDRVKEEVIAVLGFERENEKKFDPQITVTLPPTLSPKKEGTDITELTPEQFTQLISSKGNEPTNYQPDYQPLLGSLSKVEDGLFELLSAVTHPDITGSLESRDAADIAISTANFIKEFAKFREKLLS